jgi:O-antigen ligase
MSRKPRRDRAGAGKARVPATRPVAAEAREAGKSRVARICRAGVVVLVFLVPFVPLLVTPFMLFPFVTGKAFAFRIVVELMLGMYVLLALSDAALRPRMPPISCAVLAFAGALLVADLWGVHPYRSFWSNYERMDGYVTTIHLAAFYFIATTVLREGREWRRFWATSIMVSVIIAMYGLMQHAGWFAIYPEGARIDATFNNSSFLAIYLVFHMFLAGWFLLQARRPSCMWACAGILAVEGAALYFTATRSAILGLFLGAIVCAALLLRNARRDARSRRLATGFLLSAFALVAAVAALKDTALIKDSTVLSRFAAISMTQLRDESRVRVWSAAGKAVADSPLLGWGQENFNYAFDRHFDARTDSEEQWFDRAHNVVLDWLVAGGVVGFIAYAMLFATMLHALWRRNAFDGVTRSVFTGLIAAYAVHNMLVFDSLASYILLFALLAHVNSQSRAAPADVDDRATAIRPVAIGYAAAVPVAVVTLVGVYAVNFPAMMSAILLDQATSVQPQGLARNLDLFRHALAIDAFGRNEAVEQLANVTTEVTGSKAPVALKSAFHSLAAGEMNTLASRAPDDARYALLAGTFFNHYRQYDAAIPHLVNAVAHSADRPAVHIELGKSYLGGRNYDLAIAEFSAAHALQPQFPDPELVYASDQALRLRDTRTGVPTTADADAVDVIEYFDNASGHHMVTASVDEAFALDTGRPVGWTRTGKSWRAWATPGERRDRTPVCRFYRPVPPAAETPHFASRGHFYTADPTECEAGRLAAQHAAQSHTPPGTAVAYEGIAFHVRLPESGICPLGTTPVYRMRHGGHGEASDDRFITELPVKRELLAGGWRMEPDGIPAMCGAPRAPPQPGR